MTANFNTNPGYEEIPLRNKFDKTGVRRQMAENPVYQVAGDGRNLFDYSIYQRDEATK